MPRALPVKAQQQHSVRRDVQERTHVCRDAGPRSKQPSYHEQRGERVGMGRSTRHPGANTCRDASPIISRYIRPVIGPSTTTGSCSTCRDASGARAGLQQQAGDLMHSLDLSECFLRFLSEFCSGRLEAGMQQNPVNGERRGCVLGRMFQRNSAPFVWRRVTVAVAVKVPQVVSFLCRF